MKLVQFIFLSVVLYLSTKVFAANHFENFSVIDSSKLDSLYGNQRMRNKSSGLDLAEENPLYREILNELGHTYEQIGQRQADAVINGNDFNIIGGLNNIGISYSKEFIDFSITAGRTVAPDLFSDDKWIVTDEFSINISASKLLSNLKDQGAIDFSEAQYAAFAGISFKRTYRFVHFANSYSEGLILHFDRLFLGFTKFMNKDYLNLGEYEFIQKQDYLSVKAGAIAGAPIYGPIVGSVGVLAKYERLMKVDVESVSESDATNEERLRISFEKTKSASVGVSASISAEFLKLLRVTLFKYDFTYKLEESKKTYLSFYESDYEKLKSDSYYAAQVDRILKGRKADLHTLKNNIVSLEQRKTEQKSSKYNILLWGGHKNAKTQQIEIVKNGVVKRFFRHYYEKLKFKQNVFSRFMYILMKSFLKFDTIVNKDSSDSKKVLVEYSSEVNLVDKKKDINLKEDEKMSIAFTHNFFTATTTGKLRKRHKKVALNNLYNYSGVDPLAIKLFEQDYLVGPVKIKGDYKINKDGIDYILSHTESTLKSKYKQMCQSKSSGKFKWFRNLFNGCLHKMKKSTKRFYTEWALDDFTAKSYSSCSKKSSRYRFFKRRRMRRKCMAMTAKRSLNKDLSIVPLWRFKDLVQTIYLQHKSKVDILSFFGVSNVFYFGKFEAFQENGSHFSTYFNEGKFSGLGVVDNYKRKNNMRGPASIDVEN
ncbi:hypothetical protein A9Q84_12660 [Halobacteriovorax marinus]|uniref:NTF2 domain-containing protein n=1 Tax=Halobacteriovorax marinus TaxID=97084 RepID=A0A1Y5FCI6_9BACT|nr:hypothetical protein A9Q84_12660 [Halobacteriovorax marinus]